MKFTDFAGGGQVYAPAMMEFDGINGYYEINPATWAFANGWSWVVRAKIEPFLTATHSNNYLASIQGASSRNQATLIIQPSDGAKPNKLYALSTDGAGVNIFAVDSTIAVADNMLHTIFVSYDPTTGNHSLYFDHTDVSDPITSTIDTIATGSGQKRIGALTTSLRVVKGDVGFCGLHNIYIDFSVEANRLKFINSDGSPKEQDFSVSWANTGWGSQPLLWNPHGDMTNNLGSAGAMTTNGTIVVGNGGTSPPNRGIATIGTAAAHHIKTAKTAWVDAAKLVGAAYTPALMQYNGTTTRYEKASVTISGNSWTQRFSFKIPSFTGGTEKYVLNLHNGSWFKLIVRAYASDYASVESRNRITLYAHTSVGGTALHALSIPEVLDDTLHQCFVSYNAATGVLVFIIDGVDADDTGWVSRVVSIATLPSGSCRYATGAVVFGSQWVAGQLGCIGYRDVAITNWQDFMQADGSPKALDESTWTEWGAQPLFWNEHGDMENNLGSSGAMTKYGLINIGKGGN